MYNVLKCFSLCFGWYQHRDHFYSVRHQIFLQCSGNFAALQSTLEPILIEPISASAGNSFNTSGTLNVLDTLAISGANAAPLVSTSSLAAIFGSSTSSLAAMIGSASAANANITTTTVAATVPVINNVSVNVSHGELAVFYTCITFTYIGWDIVVFHVF